MIKASQTQCHTKDLIKASNPQKLISLKNSPKEAHINHYASEQAPPDFNDDSPNVANMKANRKKRHKYSSDEYDDEEEKKIGRSQGDN